MENIDLKLGDKLINRKGIIATISRENDDYWTLKYNVEGILGGHVEVKTAVSKVSMPVLLDRGELTKLLPVSEIEDLKPDEVFTNASRTIYVVVDIDKEFDAYILNTANGANTLQQQMPKKTVHTCLSKGIFWKVSNKEVIK